MKLYLKNSLFRALFAGYATSILLAGTGFAASDVGVSYTIHQDGLPDISGHSTVCFKGIRYTGTGAAIYQDSEKSTLLSWNNSVIFSGNTTSEYAGAIYNMGCFTLSGNGVVSFRENQSHGGGAIYSSGGFLYSPGVHGGGAYYRINPEPGGNYILRDGKRVALLTHTNPSSGYRPLYTWFESWEDCLDTWNLIYAPSNAGGFILSGNGDVSFSRNTAYGNGGAIFFEIGDSPWGSSAFELIRNENVTFSGNTAYGYGGAIYAKGGDMALRGNRNVLFEKNAEICDGSYRLRSIYACGEHLWGDVLAGTLHLSASENHSITFRDSIYAECWVNLNQDGAGDIIFTGATTEADLREVKGGVDGTSEEILNSRTSEIATNAMLDGGRLIVEDNAILKGQGITITEGANATIRLNGGTLDETGYAIAVSSGSGLEFEGENVLKADSVQMADGAFLSFVMGEGSGTNWDAQLLTGQLNVQLGGDLFNEHQLLTLSDASQYDTTRWTSDIVTVSGASFDSLSWNAGVLTYTPHVITPNEDGAIDTPLPDNGHAIINGNGHSLTVKNEVQLVQMALKDGIVKLEGENNGIVSVTLTEGGELVLTAGAGLKTGDIISMVASGKGELVISGDITLDNKGIKGKAGAQATVSHADAQVLGDATISNVRVEDSVIDLAEGCTVTFSHVALAAGSRITDDPATLALDDVTAELQLGVNTAVVSVDEVLQAGSTLVQNGNETVSLTLAQDAVVVQLEATTFDSVTLTGDSLVLQLSGVETEFFNGADYIAISFTSGTGLATFGTDVEVLLTLDEEHFVHGYYVQGGDHTAMLFAANDKAVVTPEPATTTLSLLALAALAARRKRK